MTAARVGSSITKQDVIEANTLLTFTEQLMPKALGEFGAAKNSVSAHKLMELLDRADAPVTMQAIWKALHQDLDSRNRLNELINDLQVAEKIQCVNGGFLPYKLPLHAGIPEAVDWSLLSPTERALVCV